MSPSNWTRHIIAFVAAGVIVFTALDLWVVWRNQSADRVMQTRNGQVLYQNTDYAVGNLYEGQTSVATLLYLSPDGGWSLEASGPWLDAEEVAPYGEVAIIRSLSSGPMNAFWLCVVGRSEQFTSIEMYNTTSKRIEEHYDLHHGGLIEPVSVNPGSELRLMSGSVVLLDIPIDKAQIP